MDISSYILAAKEPLEIIQSIVVSIAAVVGAVIAVKGLSTWRAEIRDRAHHDLAREVLEVTFDLRKSIHHVRSNWISVLERPSDKGLTYAQTEEHRFKMRWEAIQKSLEKLHTAKIRGQALWGKEFEDVFDPVLNCIHKLNMAINDYLELIKNLDKEEASPKDMTHPIWNLKLIIFHVPLLDSRRETFGDELFQAFKSIEDRIRPYLELNVKTR